MLKRKEYGSDVEMLRNVPLNIPAFLDLFRHIPTMPVLPAKPHEEAEPLPPPLPPDTAKAEHHDTIEALFGVPGLPRSGLSVQDLVDFEHHARTQTENKLFDHITNYTSRVTYVDLYAHLEHIGQALSMIIQTPQLDFVTFCSQPIASLSVPEDHWQNVEVGVPPESETPRPLFAYVFEACVPFVTDFVAELNLDIGQIPEHLWHGMKPETVGLVLLQVLHNICPTSSYRAIQAAADLCLMKFNHAVGSRLAVLWAKANSVGDGDINLSLLPPREVEDEITHQLAESKRIATFDFSFSQSLCCVCKLALPGAGPFCTTFAPNADGQYKMVAFCTLNCLKNFKWGSPV